MEFVSVNCCSERVVFSVRRVCLLLSLLFGLNVFVCMGSVCGVQSVFFCVGSVTL